MDRLVDTVARMQVDLADLRAENRMLRTPRVPQVVRAPRQAAFTTTKVPRFDGTTSWELYKQGFDEIVSSNGWDNDTSALQLFSQLEGDTLNVALLVPLPRRLSRTGLVGALSAHYGSPGRLADYRRQFEKTTRTAGEDPSIFATALETLAVKAFGDMGQIARLRLIRDRFIASHSSCELRRHLDSVPPGNPNTGRGGSVPRLGEVVTVASDRVTKSAIADRQSSGVGGIRADAAVIPLWTAADAAAP